MYINSVRRVFDRVNKLCLVSDRLPPTAIIIKTGTGLVSLLYHGTFF